MCVKWRTHGLESARGASAGGASSSAQGPDEDEGFVSFSARRLSSLLLQTTEQLNTHDGLASGIESSLADDPPVQKGSAVEAARAREAKRKKLQTEIQVRMLRPLPRALY